MSQILAFAFKHKGIILFFAAIFFILLLNSLHNSYPDEFDNILGGQLILRGLLPYSEFFSHHGPLAYFLAGLIDLFSGGQSFVKFRLLTSVFYLLILVGSYVLIVKRTLQKGSNFFLAYILIFSLAATYFWGHMFLADNISGLFFIPTYGLLFLKMFNRQKLETIDLMLISLLSFAALLTSLTYLYAGIVLIGITFLYFVLPLKNIFGKTSLLGILKFLAIFSIPYLLFLGYLIATNSLSSYYFQAVIYNKNYYIYNYPRPEGSFNFNPIRYAIVILNNFLNGFQPVLISAKNLNLRFPLGIALAASNLFVWIFLIYQRKFLMLLLSFGATVYVTARGGVGASSQDYQSSIYFMLGIFHGSFMFWQIGTSLAKIESFLWKVVFGFLAILFCLYWLFAGIFIFAELWRMSYSRYMGEMPIIYDRPQVANIINAVVPAEHYCWVGPFYFEEMYYLNCKMPSRYHWILPQFNKIPTIKEELLNDFSTNKADIIVYERNFFAWGVGPAYHKFFTDFLDQNYVRLQDLPGKRYHFVNNKSQDFTPDIQFYFEKTQAQQLVSKLAQLGHVRSD